jgi:phosphoribosylformylglycinamidine synthase
MTPMRRVAAAIITAPGTNRDPDMAFALARAGATPITVSTRHLLNSTAVVDDADLVVLPGGFSFADALGAGRLFAHELEEVASGLIHRAIASRRPVLGVCNGFQALMNLGVFETHADPQDRVAPASPRRMALGPNDGGAFTCEWVEVVPSSTACIWTAGLDAPIACPIAHGEGRLTVADDAWADLVATDRIAFRYAGRNPNGSRGAVAGICDASGLVLGLMPHPENHVTDRQHPGFHRRKHGAVATPAGTLGLRLFEEGVRHARA